MELKKMFNVVFTEDEVGQALIDYLEKNEVVDEETLKHIKENEFIINVANNTTILVSLGQLDIKLVK